MPRQTQIKTAVLNSDFICLLSHVAEVIPTLDIRPVMWKIKLRFHLNHNFKSFGIQFKNFANQFLEAAIWFYSPCRHSSGDLIYPNARFMSKRDAVKILACDSKFCAETDIFVVWATMSCYADWSKRDHVTLVIIGRCTLEHLTVQHFSIVAHVACVTFSHSVKHVARLFQKLSENENRTNTSNLRWVDLYWDNARTRMYGHDV